MAKQTDSLTAWIGRELFDACSQRIGTITGLAFPRRKFGTRWMSVDIANAGTIPVPLIGIRSVGDRLVLPYPKSYIESGPIIVGDQALSEDQQRRLALHYGFDDELPGVSCCQTCGLCRTRRRREGTG